MRSAPKKFNLRCSDSEFEQLNKKAELHNLSISRYLVQCGLSDNVNLSAHVLKNIEQIKREARLLQHHVEELLHKKSYLEQLLVSGELHNFIFYLTASAKYLHHIFLSDEKSNQSNQNNQNDKSQIDNSSHNLSNEIKNNQINNSSNGNSDNYKLSDSPTTSFSSSPLRPLAFSLDANILLQFTTGANSLSFAQSEYKKNLTSDDQQNSTNNNKNLSDLNSYCSSLDLEQIVNENQSSEIKDGETKTFILDKNNSSNSLILEQHLADQHNTNLDDKNLTFSFSSSDSNSLAANDLANDALNVNLMDCFPPTSSSLELSNLNQLNMASPLAGSTPLHISNDGSNSSSSINNLGSVVDSGDLSSLGDDLPNLSNTQFDEQTNKLPSNDNLDDALNCNLSDTQQDNNYDDEGYEPYEMTDEEYFAYINKTDEEFEAEWDILFQLVRQNPPSFLRSSRSKSNSNMNPSSNTFTNPDLANLDNPQNLDNADNADNTDNTEQTSKLSSHNFNSINQDNAPPKNNDFP